MAIRFSDGTDFDDLFNPVKYEKTVTSFQTEVGGEIVERKRYLFRKIIVKPIVSRVISSKKLSKPKVPKKKDTFIPLFWKRQSSCDGRIKDSIFYGGEDK